MIITEYFCTRYDGTILNRTYSDNKKKIVRNDGILYTEAIDVNGSVYTYIESDEDIEIESDIEERRSQND